MKRLLFVLVCGLSVLAQQPPTPTLPSIGVSASTTGDGVEVMSVAGEREVKLMSSPSSLAVSIKVVPVLAPPQGTSGSGPVLEQLISDWNAGNLMDDHGYQLCRGKISTENINARSDMIVQQLIEIKSVSGLDEISLSEVSVKSASAPTALDRIYTVGGNGYGLLAIGYKADGSVVTDGSPTQKVARVIFVTQMAIFNDEQGKIDQWVDSWPNFSINYEVRHGLATYVGRGTVSINGYGNYQPRLVATTDGGFMVSGGDLNRPYILQRAHEVSGPYEDAGLPPVYSGDPWIPVFHLHDGEGSSREFFRLRDAGW